MIHKSVADKIRKIAIDSDYCRNFIDKITATAGNPILDAERIEGLVMSWDTFFIFVGAYTEEVQRADLNDILTERTLAKDIYLGPPSLVGNYARLLRKVRVGS